MIHTLDDIAYVYCFRVCKRLKTHEQPPPMLVACRLNGEGCIGIAKEPIMYSQPMKSRLETRLGNDIGLQSPITGLSFPIGNCAEPHAGNIILERTASTMDSDINSIEFGHAFRPRTKSKKPYCDNCLLTFDQLKNE